MSPSRKRSEGGFTLVELLVTVVVASMVTVSTFMFFAGQKTVYETQTKLLNVQQNLWAAMETVTRNLRAAGTGMNGCVRPDSDGATGPDNGDPGPWGATPPQTGLRVWMQVARLTNYPANTAARIPPLWIQNGGGGAATDPDAIWVAYGVGASGNYSDVDLSTTVANMGSAVQTAAPVAGFPSPTAAFRVNEFFLLVHDTTSPPSLNLDRGCTLMQVTGINAVTHALEHTAGGSDWNRGGASTVPFTWGNPAAPGSYTPANSGIRNFGAFRWIRFAIDNTGATPNLTMQRLDMQTSAIGGSVSAPQVLAEGIEDLQVAYGCDTTGITPGTPDGVINNGTPAAATDEWTGNDVADVPPVNCRRPQAIRVTIIARSATQDTTLAELMATGNNRKPRAENGVQGQPDMFRHRVMQTTVFPRN